MLCLCMALSPCICLPLSFHSSRLLSPSHWPSHQNRIDEQIIWEKGRQKTKYIEIEKKLFAGRRIKWKVIFLPVFFFLTLTGSFSWCAIFPFTLFAFFWTYFLQLLHLVFSRSIPLKLEMQVIPLWKLRMTTCIFLWLFCSCQFLRFSTFPWMYLLAGILKSAETAFITYVCINLFISVNTILSTSILHFLGQIASRNVEVCIHFLYSNAVVIISANINPNIGN